MNLAALIARLEDNDCGRARTTLFLQRMPSNLKLGAMLRAPLSGVPIDYEIPNWFKGGKFQAVVRCPEDRYLEGLDLANRILAALSFEETQLDGMYVRFCRPRHLPVAFPTAPESNLIEISVNFDIAFELTPE